MPRMQTSQAGRAVPSYGGFWIRFSAAMWDTIIFGVPSVALSFTLMFATGIQSISYFVSLAFLILTIYMDGVLGGTPGKLMLGLRIRNENGRFIGIPYAILRYLGKIVSTIIIGIGYLMIAWDKRKQGLHDKIAGTFVLKEPGVERKALTVIGIVLGFLLPILIILGIILFMSRIVN